MLYDCFSFFNELDLLEIRLNYLDEIVDKFVLVEMDKTHSYKDKPLYFEENKERYKKFLKKIIHIKITEYPPDFEYDHFDSPWLLENYQRDCIMKGLKNAKKSDIVMISDLDEIPSINAIKQYKNGIGVCCQRMMYYYLNNLNISSPIWTSGTRIGHLSDLKKPDNEIPGIFGAQYTKKGLPTYFRFCYGEMLSDGGWHFSYLGGTQAIINKIKSFAHQELNNEQFTSKEYISNAVKSGKDIFDRGYNYAPVPIDDTFPKYILDNQEKYKHLIIPYKKQKK